jgi:hypothetical protein
MEGVAMADIWDYLDNTELVTSLFGSRPGLHDAEVLKADLDRTGITATFTLKVIPYDPAGRAEALLLVILFKRLGDVTLSGFNEQNAISTVAVEESTEGLRLVMTSSYGLEVSFTFEEGQVVSVKNVKRDFAVFSVTDDAYSP